MAGSNRCLICRKTRQRCDSTCIFKPHFSADNHTVRFDMFQDFGMTPGALKTFLNKHASVEDREDALNDEAVVLHTQLKRKVAQYQGQIDQLTRLKRLKQQQRESGSSSHSNPPPVIASTGYLTPDPQNPFGGFTTTDPQNQNPFGDFTTTDPQNPLGGFTTTPINLSHHPDPQNPLGGFTTTPINLSHHPDPQNPFGDPEDLLNEHPSSNPNQNPSTHPMVEYLFNDGPDQNCDQPTTGSKDNDWSVEALKKLVHSNQTKDQSPPKAP